MTEADAFLTRAEQYLRSAKLLLDSGDFPSSVSRSYYAMFFAAEAALLKRGFVASTHKGVLIGFGEQFVKTGVLPARFGKSLTAAFEKRQVGDYDAHPKISHEEAQELLDDARAFLETIVRNIARV